MNKITSVGYCTIEVRDELTDILFPMIIMYPTLVSEKTEKIGPYSMNISIDAEPKKGTYPLVIISHGSGGSPLAYRTMAHYLASNGFVIGIPEHPFNNRNNNSSEDTIDNFVNRPKHLNIAINWFYDDPKFSKLLKPNDVSIIGHSIGGYTALAIAGGVPSSLALMKQNGSKKLSVVHDDRVKSLILLAPAAIWFCQNKALNDIKCPILMYVGEKDELTGPECPILLKSGKKDECMPYGYHTTLILEGIPDKKKIQVKLVKNAGHFSFLSPFPEHMTNIRFPASQDPIGFNRKAFHDELNNELLNFLMPLNSFSAFINNNKIDAYASGELNQLSFAVKDNIDIANEITGYGSPAWGKSHFKPVANAICVEQLLASGASYVGKTKSDELAYSLMGMNPFYGTPLNPKAPDRVPGGSSSGSASAVASQLVDFSIGTDTAGSVRVPASNCGIWGYRPSHGIISPTGVLALAPSFDTVGIFSRSGEILEKVMQVLLAEKVERNIHYPSVCFVDDVFQIADKKILACIEPMLNRISQAHKVQSLSLAEITKKQSNIESLFELSAHLLSTEIYNTFGSWIENEKPQLSDGFTDGFNHYVKSANRKVIQNNLIIAKNFSKLLNTFLYDGNVLCFPTTVNFAPRLSEVNSEFLSTGSYIPRAMGVNAISGLSRTPQITIPIAECDGIPIGLSFIAGYGQDTILIDFCNQLMEQCFINKLEEV